MATHASTTGAVHGDENAPLRSGSPKRRRYVAVAIALVVLVLALAAVKVAQIRVLMGAGKRMQKMGPPPEVVSTYTAAKQTWDETLPSVGSVTAAEGVTISNDSPGIVSRIDFESGATVARRQVLLELDTSVERAQLASARAKRTLAASNLERTARLVSTGSLSKSQLDTDQSQLSGTIADENALAAQIERKIVRAPFAGKLGIRLVNVGQYLAPGTAITVLESPESSYVDFDLPQEDLGALSVGMPVRLRLERGDAGAPEGDADGSVFAIEPAVDPLTRNIKVRATVPAGDARFRPGMFVDVAVVEPKQATVVAVPETAVVHAPYGDSIFVVEAAKEGAQGEVARQQFVHLGDTRGDFVAVSDGITAGEVVVSEGAFKLRNGARVEVNNDVKIHPELEPRPPNR